MSLENLSTPCYVVDEGKLIKNLELLKKGTGFNWLQDSACTKMLFYVQAVSFDG